ALAIGKDWKGKLSPALYLIAIPLAFVNSWIASGLYVFVALLWVIPDPRIEREMEMREDWLLFVSFSGFLVEAIVSAKSDTRTCQNGRASGIGFSSLAR